MLITNIEPKFLEEKRRLYLSLGEEVIHLRYPQWGAGTVTEESNSTVAGGLSMVKIKFSTVEEKTFNNNIDSLYCCYHGGVRKY